jgi:predicted RNA methylase
LVARTALEFGIVVDLERSRSDPAESVVNALADPRTLALLAAWTDGTPKFRLDWSDAGHQRALTWTVVRRLGERCPALLNDPRDATWVVRAAPGSGELLLVPRLQPDPRFEYRVRDVPGSSHPTIAGALARAASERPSRVVWDPFAGGGLELIERARLGPYERLIGTDLADDALRAATENLAAARVERVELIRADARSFAPANVDLILSNPPMGRRVLRDGSVAALLEAFVAHAARVLCPGGRVVWLSPLDRRTARAATSAGLSVRNGPNLDLGGFSARLQILEKPASRGL